MLNCSIFHGDCFKILSTLGDASVDLILTDPPYAIHYRSNRRVSRPRFDHFEGDKPGDWIQEFAEQSHRLLRTNRHLYCFCRHDTYPLFFTAFQNAGFTMKRTLIWVKNNHGSGDLKGDYAPRDEWIIYAHKGRRELRGKREDNILKYDKVHTGQLLHPTQKPLDLLSLLIKKSSEPGEIVLDPYAGVLSTAVAAMDLERSFIVIDNSEEFIGKGFERIKMHKNFSRYQIDMNIRVKLSKQ